MLFMGKSFFDRGAGPRAQKSFNILMSPDQGKAGFPLTLPLKTINHV